MAQQYAHDLDEKPRTMDVQINRELDFESMFLPDNILRGLKDCGFKKPSPIQLKAIPLARCGFDLIIHAKSGTGKTLVFSLIVLEFIKLSVKRIQSIVVTPTREIALQITDVIKGVGRHLKGFRVGTFIGGTPVGDDQRNLVGCQVAVGCPGRLRHLIELGSLDLRATRVLVLDEADQLMDSVFIEDVKSIVGCMNRATRQILACSATLSPQLEEFMRVEAPGCGLATPAQLAPPPSPGPSSSAALPDPAASAFPDSAASTHSDPAASAFPDPAASIFHDPAASAFPDPAASIHSDPAASALLLGLKHFVTFTPHHPDPLARLIEKQRTLLRLLATVPFDQAIVFSNYYTRAESISSVLMSQGWAVTWLAGRQEMGARVEAVGKLKGSEVRVLVATDLAARGLDAHGVNLVVNMDTPTDSRTYLHRAGRAGRYGSHGLVVSIVTHGSEEEAYRKLLGRVGGAGMRVGVLEAGSGVDPWRASEAEVELVHGVAPPDEDSCDSGRDSELEGGGGEGSDAEADRPRRRRKRKKESRAQRAASPADNRPPSSRHRGNKKVKLEVERLGVPVVRRRGGEESAVGELVEGLSRLSTGGAGGGGSVKRKLSTGRGRRSSGEDSSLTSSSASSSGSEGEYVVSPPHPASYPPLDPQGFRHWYSLWRTHNMELKHYVQCYRRLSQSQLNHFPRPPSRPS